MLLHLLDEGVVRRLGEVRSRPVDVRFIAATNADLDALIAAGAFRQDLRDRFGYFLIRVPPLAERPDDILPLVDYYLHQEAARYGWSSRPVLSGRVRAALLAAPWPGNVRDLVHLCRYVMALTDPDETIELEHLPIDFVATLGTVLQERCDQSPRERVRATLVDVGGNKTEAARRLGVSRRQVYRLLEVAAE